MRLRPLISIGESTFSQTSISATGCKYVDTRKGVNCAANSSSQTSVKNLITLSGLQVDKMKFNLTEEERKDIWSKLKSTKKTHLYPCFAKTNKNDVESFWRDTKCYFDKNTVF